MPLSRRGLLAIAPATALRVAPAGAEAPAEPFPNRPLRMIVPFAPGGPMDFFGRPIAERLGELLGQPVVIDNRPGANGIIGTQQVASARPDGHTLLFTTGSFIGNLVFARQPLPYDPLRDMAPVTLVGGGTGMMLVGRPGLPARSMAELVTLAKTQPGGLSAAISGIGNITHLAVEQFQEFTGAELLQVTLQGTGPAITEMLAGNIDLTFATIPPVLPFLREGKLRGFGYTAPRRALLVPDVPTMQQAGYPEWELIGMLGLWTTGGTPPDRVAKLQQAVATVVRRPDIATLLREGEFEGSGMPPADFARYLERELAMQRGIARRIRLGAN